jgi:hypothetical protein
LEYVGRGRIFVNKPSKTGLLSVIIPPLFPFDLQGQAEPRNDMTALNVLKIWEYLALHDNSKDKTKNVDIVDMLTYVASSYLQKGGYLRSECIGGLFNAFIALANVTHKYPGHRRLLFSLTGK